MKPDFMMTLDEMIDFTRERGSSITQADVNRLYRASANLSDGDLEAFSWILEGIYLTASDPLYTGDIDLETL